MPRVFEKIYTAATSKVEAAGGAKAKLFWWAVGVGRKVRERERKGGRNGLLLDAQHRLADKLVLHKVRELFGGRIEVALTGAAPIDVDILSFFHACGVWVLEGYGMSETSSLSTLNTIDEHRLGHRRPPIPGCEARIAEDGEILMRGPMNFEGYYRDEAATKATMRGRLAADRRPRRARRRRLPLDHRAARRTSSSRRAARTSRRRTSRTRLKLCRWISQAVVYGDRKPYLTALLTLDPDEAKALAEKVGADDADPAALAKHPGVRDGAAGRRRRRRTSGSPGSSRSSASRSSSATCRRRRAS